MKIDKLWEEMEAEPASNIGWLTRFARPETGNAVLISLEQGSRARAIMVPTAMNVMPTRREWPECRGLEVFSLQIGPQPFLGVRLRDLAMKDVFAVLAEDVASRIAHVDEDHRAMELLNRLRRWQQFLKVMGEDMSPDEQRGLWGELHVLRTHFLAPLGRRLTVEAWNASEAAHQDFQFPLGAVEVKTSSAKQPQSIRITSERQLDGTGAGELFLHVVQVDEREVAGDAPATGTSLPGLIEIIRGELAVDSAALDVFDDRLFDRGWLPTNSNRYEGRRWTVRRDTTYRVAEGFPRIIESQLATGVGDVNYALSLSACAPYELPTLEMIQQLSTKQN